MKYDNYEFISSESVVAEVKQELKSYFEAGAISEVLIPTLIDQALRKLKVLVLRPEEAVIRFENYKSQLPHDFSMLDYALSYSTDIYWDTAAGSMVGSWYKDIQATGCGEQTSIEMYEAITIPLPGFRISMTRPKWIRVYFDSTSLCVEGCENLKVTSNDIIKIDNHKRVSATFEEGCVYIRYFSRPMDEHHQAMIPEVLEVEEYIKSYLKYKFFEQMWHSVMDESTKQVTDKLMYYKREQLEKLQAAYNYLMTKTKQQIADNIVRTRNRFSKYHIR
jgi:hypothetical protein